MPESLTDTLALVADIVALVWWLGPLVLVIHSFAFVAWVAYTQREERPDG